MIMVLGQISAIPEEVREAALLDGAKGDVYKRQEDGTSQESDLCLDPFHRTAFCSDFSDRDRNHGDCRICGIHENDTCLLYTSRCV